MSGAPEDDRFALAATLDFGARMARLRHGPVRPHWSADGRGFWYATRTDAGLEYRHVDARSGHARPLFDHAALRPALGTPLDALSRIEHDAAAGCTRFEAAGGWWCWHDAPRRLERLGAAYAAHERPSPDGHSCAFLQGNDLWLRERDDPTGRPLTSGGEPDFGWGDFSDFIAQVAPDGTTVPRAPSVLWSPDSHRLAAMRVDRRSVPMRHLLQSATPDGRPRLHGYRYPTPRDTERGRVTLWIVERDGRSVRATIDGLECHAFTHLAMGWLRWSEDGERLYLIDGNREATRLALWRIDAASGDAERLHEEHGPAIVLPSPSIGEPPVFHALRDGRFVWWSQRSGWGHLDVLAPGEPPRALTSGAWQVRALLHVDEDAGRVVFVASGREPGRDPYYTAAYAIGLAGGAIEALTPEPGHHEFWLEGSDDGARSMAPDGACFVDNLSSVRERPQARLRGRDGSVRALLQQAAPEGAWPQALPLPEPFVVTALDGVTALAGVLYKPDDFDAARRYPVIEVIYGGPQTAAVPKGWEPNRHATLAEQLAALGFVALIVDGPGTPYRSHAFQCAVHGRIESCGGLPDHVHALRALARERPWMDLDRVGIVGGSGGGYTTVRAMASFPDLYKAGVSICGNHDQADYIAMWGERYHGLHEPALYAAQDNAVVAAGITGRLLLIHGDMDCNVHPSATLRVADAMLRAGRDVEMLIVPNAGHMVILMPAVQRRVWRYFLEHLMGGVAP